VLKINKGKQQRARRVLIYGENGVGKSTLAAQFPKPLFLNIEDGIGDLDVHATDVIRSISDFMGAMIHSSETDYETIVVDTVDWLEKLIFNDVAAKAGKKTIDDIGFGKGYQAVEQQWKALFEGFAYLWGQGRHIVFTCHEQIEKFTNPDGDSYNYWKPALHIKGSGCVTEWCDEVLFVRYRTLTRQMDEGFGNKRAIAIGGKDRIIVCNKNASVEAKNRLGMPDEVPLAFDSIRKFLPVVSKSFVPQNAAQVEPVSLTGNIAGLVVEGSSKKQEVTEVIDSPF
jgi:hypothetical protein